MVSPLSARIVERLGTKVTVASGLALAGIGLVLMTGLQTTSSYGDLVWRLMLMAFGQALVMAPATESIMGSLPLAKAGVGSGGQRHDPPDRWRARRRDRRQRDVVDVRVEDLRPLRRDAECQVQRRSRSQKDSLGGALAVAGKAQASGNLGEAARRRWPRTPSSTACTPACSCGRGAAFLGAIVAAIWLPARRDDIAPSRPTSSPRSTPRRRPRAPDGSRRAGPTEL